MKKILIKIALFTLLLIALNEVYYRFFWKKDVHIHADTLENLWDDPPGTEVLYFGESSNFFTEWPDTPKRRISEFLDSLVPAKVEEVDNAGIQASNYLHILKHLPEHYATHTIIITLNYRAFGPVWQHDKNSNYLRKADRLIAPGPKLLNRFLIALKAYGYRSDNELEADMLAGRTKPYPAAMQLPYKHMNDWNASVANGSILRPDGSWDMDKIPVASHHVKNFAFVIEADNPTLADYDAIVAYCAERELHLVFHLMSENIHESDSLVGPELASIMRHNKEFLLKHYKDQDVLIVDNFETVPVWEFRDRTFPTEHYSHRGKRMCARVIRDSLIARWPNLFE